MAIIVLKPAAHVSSQHSKREQKTMQSDVRVLQASAQVLPNLFFAALHENTQQRGFLLVAMTEAQGPKPQPRSPKLEALSPKPYKP